MQNSSSIHTMTIHLFLSMVAEAASGGIPILKSGFADLSASVTKLFGQFVYNVFEYDTVYVLAKQIYEKPITNIAFANHLQTSSFRNS